MRRAAAAVLVALVVFSWAPPASAHAELRSTEPASGVVLEAPPERVVLEFSEPVEASFGAIRVYDADGGRLDDGRAFHPEGRPRTVATEVPELRQGPYVVTWRVISADSHPVQGAFTFRIGEAVGGDDNRALAERLLAARGGSPVVGAAYALVRLVVFASLVVLVGGAGFVATLWPAGAGNRRTRRLLVGAWMAAVASTAAGIGLQGAYGAGLPLGGAVDPDVITAVVDTRFGRVSLARLGLLVAAAPLLVALVRARRPAPVLQGALVSVGAGLLLTPGLAGHASTGELVGAAVAADLVHLGAVSAWLGGLAMLVVAVLPRGDAAELGAVVPRFSRLAFAAVVVILASGLFQSWRQLGTLDALTATTYGRLLAVKVVLFVAMVGLASASRSWVRRRYCVAAVAASLGPGAAAAGPPVTELSRLRRSVGAEVAVAAAVLAVTALLVNAIPGRTALALPYSTELEAGELLVDLTVDPAKAGPLDLHLYTLTPAGLPAEVEEVTAELRLPARDVGPIKVPLQRAGPNHFVAYAFDVPIPGEWQLEVVARTSDVDQEQATTTIPIR